MKNNLLEKERSEIIERFRKFINLVTDNIAKLEREIGAKERNIRSIMVGDQLPTVKTLYLLKKGYPELNMNWMITGDEPMRISQKALMSAKEPDENFKYQFSAIKQKATELEMENVKLQKRVISLYDRIEQLENK